MANTKKHLRADDALSILSKDGNAVFFTLTTPDVVDYSTIRSRWRHFRHDLFQDMRRAGLSPEYLMNYERHPGYLQKVVRANTLDERIVRSDGFSHGWHIHGVMSCFWDVVRYRSLLNSCGFGRVDVRRVTNAGVSDYLTKHALKAYRGISSRERKRSDVERLRLVNSSRGIPSLSSYVVHSDLLDLSRLINASMVLEIKSRGEKVSRALSVWKRACFLALCGESPYAIKERCQVLHEM